MLAVLKTRLRDPRLYTVALYILLLGLTAWIAPQLGIRGETLRALLSGQGGVGMLLAWLLKSPLHKDAKADADAAPADDSDA